MIRLRTLGALDLRNGGGQELRAVLAQPKRAALLAYLALAAPRGSYRRDTLLALFWPDQDTEHARNALSQAAHFLRRSLGPQALVASNGDELRLDWKDLWCDAVAFEEALNAGHSADALELYQGDLLDGFHVADAPEFQRWLEMERTRLASRYAGAVESVAEERQTAGDFDGAVRLWRRLAARDIYSSRLALRLMRALAAAGDPGAAIQHARVHEVLLREELDVAPDPELAALVRQLQGARAGPQRTVGREAGPGTSESPNPAEFLPITPDSPGPKFQPSPRRHATTTVAALVALFAIGGGAVALRIGAREPSIPPIRSLAVLPLENLSGDSAQQTFADGMHDALISELARYPELTVISRTSVVQYKGSKKRLPEIARELKVQGIVEGTILRDGGRVRVNVQLLHGPTDRHLWARSYERDLRHILVLQSELADAIARELHVAANPLERSRRITSGTDSVPRELQLRELYLKGRHAEQTRSLAGLETAKEAYRQAIERDSTFALAYAGLAGVYELMGSYGFMATRPALDTARVLARSAAALDSTIAESRIAVGVALADAGDFQAAEREFQTAIRFSPSNARAHYWYAILLVALGRGEEALRETQRSAELDPFAPRGITAMDRYARYLITGERPFLKVPAGQRWSSFLKGEPGEPWARRANAIDLAEAGKCTEARSELEAAEHLAPGTLLMESADGMVRWFCNDRRGARAGLQQLKRRADAQDQGIRIAMIHTLFGERDSAFAWAERTEWTLNKLTDLRANRWLDALRSDPRYPELLRRLGLR